MLRVFVLHITIRLGKHLRDLVNSVLFFARVHGSSVIVAYISLDSFEQQPLASIQLMPQHLSCEMQ